MVWLAALCAGLGGMAAALPTLLGEPPGDARGLRGVAAGVVAWLLAIVLSAGGGWKDVRRASPEKSADPARRAGVLETRAKSLVTIAGAIAFVVAPAVVAGCNDGELSALVALLQGTWGWATPVHYAIFGALTLVGTYSAATLLGSFAAHRPRELVLLGGGLAAGFGLVVVAIRLLESYSATVGSERATKAISLGFLATLTVAAAFAKTQQRTNRDRRSAVLAAGSFLTGALASALAIDYVTPPASDLADVRVETDRDGWTILEGNLARRPDLFGVFALAPGSRRLQLVGVGPGPAQYASPPTPQIVSSGLAYLDLRALAKLEGTRSFEGRPPHAKAEIRVRSRWSRFLDRGTGLFVSAPGSFAVSPDLSYAVSAVYDRTWLESMGREGERWSFSSAGPPPPRFQLELCRRSVSTPLVIAESLPEPARVVWIDRHATRFLIAYGEFGGQLVSASEPGTEPGFALLGRVPGSPRAVLSTSRMVEPRHFGSATYVLDERGWSDRRAASIAIGSEIHYFPDRRQFLTPCGGWCVVETESLRRSAVLTSPAGARTFGPSALPLSDGSVALLWHDGGPRLHWRMTHFAPGGHELRTVDLAGSTAARFAGELDDGSIVIARHAGRAQTINAPTFGWTIEAVEPASGQSRTLATDLGSFPFSVGSVTRVFLARDGRLLVPTATGMHDATRGPARWKPTLASTGQLTTSIPPSSEPRPSS